MEAQEHSRRPAAGLKAGTAALAARAARLRALAVAVWRDPTGAAPHTCLFWCFWFSLAFFPAGYGLREVMPLLCCVFLLLYYRRAWRQSALCRLPVRPLFYCLGAMILMGVIFSEDVPTSLLHAGTGINKGFILPFIAMECARDEKDLRRLVWACVLACFWQGLDGLWQAHTGHDCIMGYPCNAGRLTGSLGDYTVGNYIALALVPAFALWFVLRRVLTPAATTFLWLAALWPAFFLLIGAASRSGALALAAAAGLWFVLAWPEGRRLKPALCAPGVLLAVLALQGRARVEAVLEDGRWSLWELGWRVFAQHPWLGNGAGTYNEAFRALGLAPEKDLITISHPHNLYLDILYAHGLLGFALGMTALLGFLWWGHRRIRPRLTAERARGNGSVYWRLTAWFWLGYAAWFANGIFGHDFYRTWWLGLAMSHLGVMLGAVVNGPEPAAPEPEAS